MGRRDFPPGRLQCASLGMLVRPVVLAIAVGLALSAGVAHAGKRKSRGSSAGPAPAEKVAPSATESEPAPLPEASSAALALAPAADVDPPPASADRPPGSSTDPLFLRSAGGEVVVFPTARLQIDAAFFPRQTPKSGAFVRRAQVGLAGWLGGLFYFDVSVDGTPAPPGGPDSVAPAALSPADEYLAFAPAGDQFILQVGQFDVPFTLENRTSDAYTPFIERSMAARLVGAPRNKDVGAMAHGLIGDFLYYSGGIFDGEGPRFRPLDNQPDPDRAGGLYALRPGRPRRGRLRLVRPSRARRHVSPPGDGRRCPILLAALDHRPGHANGPRAARAGSGDGVRGRALGPHQPSLRGAR